MIEKIMDKYVKPKSSTWWTGLATIGYGIFTKDPQTILMGFSMIGLRGAIG